MRRAKKICSTVGCFELVDDGGSRCPEHARTPWSGPRTESSKRTGTRHFNQVVRPAILERDGGMCRAMLDGCTRMATEIHHAIEVVAGGSDRPDNLVSVCASCHAKLGAAAGTTRVAPTPPRRGRRRRAFDGVSVPRTIWTDPI